MSRRLVYSMLFPLPALPLPALPMLLLRLDRRGVHTSFSIARSD
jgi:hypothetical protein